MCVTVLRLTRVHQLTCRECNRGCEKRATLVLDPQTPGGTDSERVRGLSGISLLQGFAVPHPVPLLKDVSLVWGFALSLQVSSLRCVPLKLDIALPVHVSRLNGVSLMLRVAVPLQASPVVSAVGRRTTLGKGPHSRPTYCRRGRTRQRAKQTM
jgi:hypothetical protein